MKGSTGCALLALAAVMVMVGLAVRGFVIVVIAAIGILGWWLFRQAEQRRSRPCPRCGRPVRVGVLECPSCGFDFRTIGADWSRGGREQDPEMERLRELTTDQPHLR